MSLDLIATIYGETPQGGTVESPVPLTGVSSFKVDSNTITLPIPRPLHRVGDVRDVCRTRVKSVYDKRIVLDGTEASYIYLGMFYLNYRPKWPTPVSQVNGVCSHYLYKTYDKGKIGLTSDGGAIVYTPDGDYADDEAGLTNWKAYLASQKAAGTPVVVYYQSTAYDGTNGLDVCLTEYQTGFVELDGTEAWNWNTSLAWAYISTFLLNNKTGIAPACSHYQGTGAVIPAANQVAINELGSLIIKDPSWKSVDDAKSYLAAQKEAGTPVQVAYQLATPETYATDPLDIYVTTMFPVVVSTGPITYEVIPQIHPFKTDWKIQPKTPEGYYNGDWFEIEDYNHILDNYQTIYKIAKALYPDLQIPTFVSPTLGAPTKASEINTIERTIDAFKTLTIALSDVGATKTWLDNGNLFNFEDINRWEQVALSYYTVFLGQVELLPKLQFKLGGAQF